MADVSTMTDEEFENYMRTVEDVEEEEVTAEESDTDYNDNEDLEQPGESSEADDSDEQTDTDSNDDNDSEENSDEEGSEETSADAESTEDAGTEQSTEDTANTPTQELKTEMYKIRADGQELELTVDELKVLASKGINYGRKTQELSKYRKAISALKEAEIDDASLNLLIDAYKGDKAAIGKLFDKNGIDPLEYEKPEQEYTPKRYGKSDIELDIQEIVESISKDPEYDRTQRILATEWDERSWDQLVDSVKNPNQRLRDGATFIEGLHRDVKNGMYEKIMPIQKKLKLFGGNAKSDFDYYMEAVGVYQNQQQQQYAYAEQERSKVTAKADKITNVKAQEEQRNKDKVDSKKRKAAAITKASSGKRDIIDYLDDMNDADFEKEMEKILK